MCIVCPVIILNTVPSDGVSLTNLGLSSHPPLKLAVCIRNCNMKKKFTIKIWNVLCHRMENLYPYLIYTIHLEIDWCHWVIRCISSTTDRNIWTWEILDSNGHGIHSIHSVSGWKKDRTCLLFKRKAFRPNA